MQRGEIGGTMHIAPDRIRAVVQVPMSDTARLRRLSAVLLLSATSLAAASDRIEGVPSLQGLRAMAERAP